jgi:hypothetical protein
MNQPVQNLLQRFLIFILQAFSLQVIAQNDSSDFKPPRKERSMFSVGAGVQHGFIFAHSQAVQNTKGANPTGVELSLSWQRNDAAVWELCNCYPRRGLFLAYYDYDTRILGKSLTAAYFLEPTYRLNEKFFFSFKVSSGVSYLTRPFDSIKNPGNQSYSTHLSAFLLLGTGLWFRLNDRWSLNASINYQHESNGGVRQPNKGINWPTAGVAVNYQKTSRAFYRAPRLKEKFWRSHSLRWDAGLFGVPRRVLDENGNSSRSPLIGVMLQTSKQIGRINALNAGVEIYHDPEVQLRLKRDSISASSLKAGLLVGHEFLLGRFLFSQRLGMYVFDQTPYYDQLYHRWGLHYQLNKRVGIGFNLQAHKHVADYADLRLTYSWQNFDDRKK